MLEGDRDREAAVAGRVRRQVDHVLDAVDLLFDRRDHGRGDDVGAGARILARDGDRRRRDFRILRDRQARKRHAAEDHENDRDHGGKNRPINEEVRYAHAVASPATFDCCGGSSRRAGAAGFAPCSSGVHLLAGARLHQTVDDDAIVGADALLDDAQIVGRELSERHVFDARGVLIVDHDDKSARLLGADGDVGNQQTLRKAATPARARARTCPA